MNCAKHVEEVARAICMGCGAAMCTDCAQRRGNQTEHTCSDVCARNVARVHQVRESQLSLSKKGALAGLGAGMLAFLVGSGLIVISSIDIAAGSHPIDYFGMAAGAAFLLAGVWIYAMARRSMQTRDHDSEL